ncbi:MAG: FIST N-terminal domain-containing protein [Gammaproteobacteria bacterium]|nr:FIST N-terminal domain-containing protein [Gammaproteobacteria bacterium]
MQRITFYYSQHQGWSLDSFPDWDSPETLLMVFGASEFLHNPAPLQTLRDAFPTSLFIGCSTAGEIFADRVSDHSLSVALIRFAHTPLRIVTASVSAMKDSFKIGEHLAQQLVANDLRSLFVLSDGLHVNGSELVKGLCANVADEVVITGGLAGDGERFQQSWVMSKGLPEESKVVALGFYGDAIRVSFGSKGGWDIFGPERRVTRSVNNVLYELDGRPALELYKAYLGELAEGLPSTGLLFPLALRQNREDERHRVRTILAVDEAAQSLTFAGDVPQGWLVQLMRANFERLIDGAERAAMDAQQRIAGVDSGQKLSIAISCVGRRLVLRERSEEELEVTLAALKGDVEQIGFYSYGEISPFVSGSCDLHNQTMTLTVFSEAK